MSTVHGNLSIKGSAHCISQQRSNRLGPSPLDSKRRLTTWLPHHSSSISKECRQDEIAKIIRGNILKFSSNPGYVCGLLVHYQNMNKS